MSRTIAFGAVDDINEDQCPPGPGLFRKQNLRAAPPIKEVQYISTGS